MKKPELLIPAGSFDTLKTAIHYGADAVYIGGGSFSLRAKAKNFGFEEMQAAVRYAHERDVNVHVTVNISAHEYDLEAVCTYLKELREIGPDALIISDAGIFSLAREECPGIPLHISTQANSTNSAACSFWHSLGASRIVLARELSLKEIEVLRKAVPEELELECFVHGAMCISYSGRCLLSNYLTGRDANRGACTHPCRWTYALMEEKRPGEFFPVYENERGTHIMNSKDLCMVDHLPDLIHSGIDSFKIEGRMKTALYIAAVARTYRLALDDYFADPARYEKRIPWYREQIAKCTYREFTTGFYYGKPGNESQSYDHNVYASGATYLGTVQGRDENGFLLTRQKNKFSQGDRIEVMKKDGTNPSAIVRGIYDAEGKPMESAPHPGMELHIDADLPAEPMDILRR